MKKLILFLILLTQLGFCVEFPMEGRLDVNDIKKEDRVGYILLTETQANKIIKFAHKKKVYLSVIPYKDGYVFLKTKNSNDPAGRENIFIRRFLKRYQSDRGRELIIYSPGKAFNMIDIVSTENVEVQ